MSLSSDLDAVLEHWKRLATPVVPDLPPALSRAEINEAMRGLPFTLPEDVYEFYMWHDGTVNSGLLPYWYLMSLEDAIRTYNEAPSLFVNLVEEVQESGVLEKKAENVKCCFPLFFDAGGTLLTLPCSENTQPGEPLISWDEELPQVIYKDIQSLVDTVVAASKIGAYFLPHEGLDVIDVDMSKWLQAARECNPNVSYWLNDTI